MGLAPAEPTLEVGLRAMSSKDLGAFEQYYSRKYKTIDQRFTETGAILYTLLRKIYRAQIVKVFIFKESDGAQVFYRHYFNHSREMKTNVAKLKIKLDKNGFRGHSAGSDVWVFGSNARIT